MWVSSNGERSLNFQRKTTTTARYFKATILQLRKKKTKIIKIFCEKGKPFLPAFLNFKPFEVRKPQLKKKKKMRNCDVFWSHVEISNDSCGRISGN